MKFVGMFILADGFIALAVGFALGIKFSIWGADEGMRMAPFIAHAFGMTLLGIGTLVYRAG